MLNFLVQCFEYNGWFKFVINWSHREDSSEIFWFLLFKAEMSSTSLPKSFYNGLSMKVSKNIFLRIYQLLLKSSETSTLWRWRKLTSVEHFPTYKTFLQHNWYWLGGKSIWDSTLTWVLWGPSALWKWNRYPTRRECWWEKLTIKSLWFFINCKNR